MLPTKKKSLEKKLDLCMIVHDREQLNFIVSFRSQLSKCAKICNT